MSGDMGAQVVVTHGGVATKLLIPAGATITKDPITGLGQVVTTGDTAERADQRTPQVIWTDQRGGMGEFAYVETEGLTAFTDSDCDTRFPGLVVLPPAVAELGGAAGLVDATPVFVEYLGVTNAYVIAWAQTQAGGNSARRYDGGGWNDLQVGGVDINNLTGYAEFRGYYLFSTANSSAGLYTSTDGVTWAASAKARACTGICAHDNKVWVYNSTDNTLDWATDPTAAHASWSTSGVFYLYPGERVNQVVEWRDRVGRAAVYLVTNRRIVWYDEDADAFLDLDDLRPALAPVYAYPRLTPSGTDGNAYVTLFDWQTTNSPADTVLVYSGVRGRQSPATRGGLPATSRLHFTSAAASLHWTYFFGYPRESGQFGRVLALNEQGGWSTVLSTSRQLRGGGYSRGKLFAATHDGASALVYEAALADTPESPLFVARTYDTDSRSHEYAFTDGGTPNMDKQALWVTVQCLDHTSANKVPGLAADTSVAVQYRRDVDAAWTTLGTLTSASTFPAVLPIASGDGVSFKQIKVRLTLDTNAAARTPVVTSVAVAYVRREEPRYAYGLPVDLSDVGLMFAGLDRAQLLARIDAWTQPDAIVRLDVAGGDWSTDPATAITVLNCTCEYRASIDPAEGVAQLGLRFSDVTPPASG